MFTSESVQYTNNAGENVTPQVNVESLYYEQAKRVSNGEDGYDFHIDRYAVVKHMALGFELAGDVSLTSIPSNDTSFYDVLSKTKKGIVIEANGPLQKNNDGSGIYSGSITEERPGRYYDFCGNPDQDFDTKGIPIFAVYEQKFEAIKKHNEFVDKLANINKIFDSSCSSTNVLNSLKKEIIDSVLSDYGILKGTYKTTNGLVTYDYKICADLYDTFYGRIDSSINELSDKISRLENAVEVLSSGNKLLLDASNMVDLHIKNLNGIDNEITSSINSSINNIEEKVRTTYGNQLNDILNNTILYQLSPDKPLIESWHSLMNKAENHELIPGVQYNLLYNGDLENHELFPCVLQLIADSSSSFIENVTADCISEKYFPGKETNINLVKNTNGAEGLLLYIDGENVCKFVPNNEDEEEIVQLPSESDTTILYKYDNEHTYTFQNIVSKIKYDQWTVKYDISTNRITYLKDEFGNEAFYDFFTAKPKTFDVYHDEDRDGSKYMNALQIQYVQGEKICYNNIVGCYATPKFYVNVNDGKVFNNEVNNSQCTIVNSNNCNICNANDVSIENSNNCNIVNSKSCQVNDSDNILLVNVKSIPIKDSDNIHICNINGYSDVEINGAHCVKWCNDYGESEEKNTKLVINSSFITMYGNNALTRYTQGKDMQSICTLNVNEQ